MLEGRAPGLIVCSGSPTPFPSPLHPIFKLYGQSKRVIPTQQVNIWVSVPTCLAVLIRTSEPFSKCLQVISHSLFITSVFPIMSLPAPRQQLEARVTWSRAGCPKGMYVCSPYFLTAPGLACPRAFKLSHRADGGSSPSESCLATSCEEPDSQKEAGVPGRVWVSQPVTSCLN